MLLICGQLPSWRTSEKILILQQRFSNSFSYVTPLRKRLRSTTVFAVAISFSESANATLPVLVNSSSSGTVSSIAVFLKMFFFHPCFSSTTEFLTTLLKTFFIQKLCSLKLFHHS